MTGGEFVRFCGLLSVVLLGVAFGASWIWSVIT